MKQLLKRRQQSDRQAPSNTRVLCHIFFMMQKQFSLCLGVTITARIALATIPSSEKTLLQSKIEIRLCFFTIQIA